MKYVHLCLMNLNRIIFEPVSRHTKHNSSSEGRGRSSDMAPQRVSPRAKPHYHEYNQELKPSLQS
jgi:hypothetical protein